MSDSVLRKDVLPCVVQVGFAGARRLHGTSLKSDQAETFIADLRQHLKQAVKELHEKLNVGERETGRSENYFFCGISSLAKGADVLFTEVCRDLDIPQRILFPQHRDQFFNARDSNGEPDFDESEKETALKLLRNAQVIEERMVSVSHDRHERFSECNREIVLASDVAICLFCEDSGEGRGGTQEVLDFALSQAKPVIEIRVTCNGGKMAFVDRWHGFEQFDRPLLPDEIASLPNPVTAMEEGSRVLPSVDDFCGVVKGHVSDRARKHSGFFSYAIAAILLTHVLATLCATIGLASPQHNRWIIGLLALELVFLGVGFTMHVLLHKKRVSAIWALNRLLAEINRSVRSLGRISLPLDYLLGLQLPKKFTPLLRTLEILHLRASRQGIPVQDWKAICEAYVSSRLTDQIAYYSQRHQNEKRWLHLAHGVFYVCSAVAFIATLLELLMVRHHSEVGPAARPGLSAYLGIAAILLPVLAVAALSWSAAKDYEARVHIYGEMVEFLQNQVTRILSAISQREAERLIKETETHLLRETADWYSRRTHTHGPS